MHEQTAQSRITALAKIKAVLADRGKRWRSFGRIGQIIKTDDADIFRDPVSCLEALMNHLVGNGIVATEDSSSTQFE